MKESLSHQRFRSRIEYLEQNMQAVDIAIVYALRQTKKKVGVGGTIPTALEGDQTKYDRLRHPVRKAPKIFNHSKSLNFEHTMISLYRFFGEYLKGLLEEMYAKDPMQVVGKVPGNTLAFHELVSLGNFPAIKNKMIDTTFRRLEDERSTTKLFDKILSHTQITLTPQNRVDALTYLEMRHLFIHNNGKCDSKFARDYGSPLNLKEHDDLPTDYKTTSKAIMAVSALLKEVDQRLIDGGYIASRR